MSATPAIRTIYKVLRSFLFTVIVVAVTLYVCLYVTLSIPSVQDYVKGRVENEVSRFLKSDVDIESLNIYPFNEVRLKNVAIYTPEHEKCISVGTLGAGIHLWKLIYDHKIEITYAEIIELDGRIWKNTATSPLNIDFIIKALAPKDKNKPPTPFDLKLYNVVIRKSRVSYDVRDSRTGSDPAKFDKNHILLKDLKADVALPGIKNDDFIIDLRRLSFVEKSGFTVERLGLKTHITASSIDVKDISLRLPESVLKISDINLKFKSFSQILSALKSGNHLLQIESQKMMPSDFKAFYPPLASLNDIYNVEAEVSGNLTDLHIERFNLRGVGRNFNLTTEAILNGLPDKNNIRAEIQNFEFYSNGDEFKTLSQLIPGIKPKVEELIAKLGDIGINLKGRLSVPDKDSKIQSEITTALGSINIDGYFSRNGNGVNRIGGEVISEGIDIGTIIDNPKFGNLAIAATGEVNINKKEIDFSADANIPELEYNGMVINNISATGEKNGKFINGYLEIDDDDVGIDTDADILLDGVNSKWRINADIRRIIPSRFGLIQKYPGYLFSANSSIDLSGNTADNITGSVNLQDISFAKSGNPSLRIPGISLISEISDSIKNYELNSDFIKGGVKGDFTFSGLAKLIKEIIANSMPTMLSISNPEEIGERVNNATLDFTIHPDDEMAQFFAFPIKPYSDIKISGSLDGNQKSARFSIDAPYLIQGKSKLIRGSSLDFAASMEKGIDAIIKSTIPAKNDEANLTMEVNAFSDRATTDISWTFEKNKTATGNLSLEAELNRNILTGKPEVALKLMPSSFRLNGSEWNIDRATIGYADNSMAIDNLRIWHAGQFVNISGKASGDPMDAMTVKLAGIDLSYIFETLNINYVTFGGIATGEMQASQLFGGMPVLRTKKLFVKDFSYNDAVLGDGNLESHWVNDSKKVAINADIRRGKHRVALIGGGVYVTRDSLSFDMLADHVNIELLKPFMSAFTSDVGGEASGRVKLYGTFKNIDLKGRVYADSISMKVDYTNVYYHGRDSVIITPGKIDIPSFRLYDKYGNSAVLKGEVNHRFFHEPKFEFKLSDARNLLCFDTNNKINPDWYGKIFASGGGSLRGWPGMVSMLLDVSTSAESDFTFVLSETQTATDYEFLTFSDNSRKRKEELEALAGNVDLEERFRNSIPKPQPDRPSVFSMDIRCSVTPQARLNLIMDPKSGDKIVARGFGPMQIAYDTESDEMKIYGKYTLDEGNYNFSLQDLILRDFKINQGSSISFNGDPMQGVLDITAAYRVNTSLSDLDKSFSTDRDLNRTNVPVDALLKVNGDMRKPEITFDISLPTLTQDVERKVKSIISTDDMMNRQIIYLLALNRFYTPEYMGATSNGGGELASVASSTLSSQLSSFMGQLTDKVTLAPSFRSDKGDFSDMEVDVALSSRLLDNRLLINGNFGYRDRSTSQSTFIGDFDIEYLLNKSGGLRLKAYNHFNDQNYYLRSAITTQGIGVIYRKDFDNPFTFLKRKKKKDKEIKVETNDREK